MPEERTARRRDAALLDAIREATRGELDEYGYEGVGFEGVARRARTSKPVLYRRYRSRAHMVADALMSVTLVATPEARSGSLRADLLNVLTAQLEQFRQFGVVVYRGIVGEADEELLDDIMSDASEFARRIMREILGKARDRGEIGSAEIADRALVTPLALMRHELFFSRETVTTESLADLVDTVILPLYRALSREARTTDAEAAETRR